MLSVTLLGAMVLLAGCAVAEESEDMGAEAPAADGAAIIEYLGAADYQNAWQHLPGGALVYRAGSARRSAEHVLQRDRYAGD